MEHEEHDGGGHSLKDEVELTGLHVMKKLREFVQPPGKKGLWLRHLSDRKLAEVYHRLKLGQPAHYISSIAQKDWGLMRDSSTKSMSRGVQKFRDKILGELKVDAIKTPQGEKEYDARKKRALTIVKKLDGLGRIRWLIEVQTERLEELRSKEKSSMPFKSTERTVQTLGELLDVYMRYQVKLGLLDSKPQEFNVNVKHRFDALLEGVTDDGARLISAANNFLELAAEQSIIMVPDKVGLYSPDGSCEENDVLEGDEE